MPTTNYVNPSANGLPYGDWKPEGFLAGWQYADKLKDYHTTKDLSNEASFLTNEMSRMRNEDYGREADLRSVQREILKQRGGHELNRIPTEEGIKGMQADEQYSSLFDPEGRRARVQTNIVKSIYGLDETKRKHVLGNTLSTVELLQGQTLTGDPNLILQSLQKSGADIDGLYDPDPEVVREKLRILQDQKPEKLKSAYDRMLQGDKDAESYKRLLKEIESDKEIARINSFRSAGSASAEKEKRLREYEQAYIKIMSKPASQRTAEEQAQLDYIEMVSKSYQAQQEAIAEREVTSPGRTIDSIEGKPTAREPRSTAKSSGKTMILPEIGEVEVLEQLPGGAIRFKKGNRTGTWRP